MIEWLIKRVLVGKINELLRKYQSDVGKVKTTLRLWIGRLEKILALFKSTLAKLDDNSVSPEELGETANEVEELIRKW